MELTKSEREMIYIALHKRLRVYQKEMAEIEATGRPFTNRKAFLRSRMRQTEELMAKMGVSKR